MYKNKITVLLIVFLLLLIKVNGQFMPKNLPNYNQQQWHFGFTLGMNTMNFNLFPVDQLIMCILQKLTRPKVVYWILACR